MSLRNPDEHRDGYVSGVNRRETDADIQARFGIAQDGKPSEEQLEVQNRLRDIIATAGYLINNEIEDSPEKSNALQKLEEALMWSGKAIFKK